MRRRKLRHVSKPIIYDKFLDRHEHNKTNTSYIYYIPIKTNGRSITRATPEIVIHVSYTYTRVLSKTVPHEERRLSSGPVDNYVRCCKQITQELDGP